MTRCTLPDSPWSFRGERVTCAWLSDMTATRVSPSMYKQLPGGVMRGHVSGITVSSRVRAFDLRDPACVDGLSPGFQRWACHRTWMPDVAATRVSASLWERYCHGGGSYGGVLWVITVPSRVHGAIFVIHYVLTDFPQDFRGERATLHGVCCGRKNKTCFALHAKKTLPGGACSTGVPVPSRMHACGVSTTC